MWFQRNTLRRLQLLRITSSVTVLRRDFSGFKTRCAKALIVHLQSWCVVDEALYVAYYHEYWKLHNGLDYNEKFMKSVAKQRAKHSRTFLEQEREPRRLFLKSLVDLSDAEKTSLVLKLEKAREEKIVTKKYSIDGTPVNWNNWRRFNVTAKRHKARKEVYDEFIKKTRLIAPLIRSLHGKSRRVHRRYGMDPLTTYLEDEGLTLTRLKDLVTVLGKSAKAAFLEDLYHYSKEILGGPAEYYDNLYYFRAKVFKALDPILKAFHPAEEPLKVLKAQGFDVSKLQIDAEERVRKFASAECIPVQIPNDVRLLVRPVSPYEDLSGSFHEFGHGMHFVSIDPSTAYEDKYAISAGVAEIFSELLEDLLSNQDFLIKRLGISLKDAEEIAARRRFLELFFLVSYAANSLMKIDFWEENLSIEQASERYAKYSKEFTDTEIPGEYWQLHHILPDYDMYVPSYLIAAVRMAELEQELMGKFGSSWWKEAAAGDFIRDLVRSGAAIDLASFSKLDSRVYLNRLA